MKELGCEVIKIGYETDFNGDFEFEKEPDTETVKLISQIHEAGFINQKNKDLKGTYSAWQVDGKFLYCESGKAYGFEGWLELIVEKIIKPRGYFLNGEVEWIGEDPDDRGKIIITDNKIKYKLAQITWVDA